MPRRAIRCLIFVFAICATAMATATTTRAEIAGTETTDARVRWVHPALWKIASGTTTVYLFGSVHILPGNMAWADAEIDAAIRSADVFCFEASLDTRSLLEVSDVVRAKGTLPRGRTLRRLLSRQGLANYNALMTQLGSPPQQLDNFRPWLAMLLLSMRHSSLGTVSASGSVDPSVMSYARSHGREMRYFETAKQQIAIYSDMDERTAVDVFETSIAQFNERNTRTAAFLEAWARGESESLAAMLSDSFAEIPAARRDVVDDRNREFAIAIRRLLNEPNRTFFVTVGAGHYGGPTGVIALLCADDVRVMRLGRQGAVSASACAATRQNSPR
jgi:uncharacterized protein YbaP (TraB family)